jgi:hypothetical protein
MHHAEETCNSLTHAGHKGELRGLIDALWEQSNQLVDVAGEASGQMPSPFAQTLTALGESRDKYVEKVDTIPES